MALLIDNDVAERVLEMADAIEVIDSAFTQLGVNNAAFYPLTELISPTAERGDYYVWGSHIGAIRDPPRLAFRFKSDVMEWVESDGNRRRKKFNVEPGSYMGFILLIDTTTGELIGLLNDGIIQHIRVGATAGVACDLFAREDASSIGILGSGGMARVYMEAFAAVRDIEDLTVYSPTEEHRTAFAAEVRENFGIQATAVDTPEVAISDVDIAATCTDASQPVYRAEWVEPGTLLVNVRSIEIPPDVVEAVDRRFTTSNQTYDDRLIGTEDERATYRSSANHGDQDTNFPTLGAVLNGQTEARHNRDESIYFDNRAAGIQFAATANLVHKRACEQNLGTAIPLKWFQQRVRN